MENLLEPEAISEDIKLAKEVVQGVLKAKKLLNMYPPNNPVYIKTSGEVYNKFREFFDLNNKLSLKIQQYELKFNNEQIYYNPDKNDNLALLLFKDGIKEIDFLSSLTQQEIEDFIKILATDFEEYSLDDDIVTLLWERDFEHIKYVVREDLLTDEEIFNEDNVYEETKDKISSDENLKKAYHDALKAKEEQTNIVVSIDESDIQHIAGEIEQENQPKIDKITTILFELLHQTKETSALNETIWLVKDTIGYCIKEGDFKRASFILNALKSLIKDKTFGEEGESISEKIYTTINSESFVEKIGRVLDSGSIIDKDEFIRYIRQMGKDSIPLFMQLMGELRNIKGRMLIVDTLSIIGRLDLKTLAKGLHDTRWYVVRNIISIMGKIGDSGSIENLAELMSHPKERVRMECIRTISRIGGQNILPYLKNALNDSVSAIRIAAAKAIGNIKTEAAKKILLAELSKKDFLQHDFKEKKGFYRAIANWPDQETKAFLLTTLNKNFFWRRAQNNETRACAAYALGIIGDTAAIPSLKKASHSRNKLLRESSIFAMERLTTEDKKKLGT